MTVRQASALPQHDAEMHIEVRHNICIPKHSNLIQGLKHCNLILSKFKFLPHSQTQEDSLQVLVERHCLILGKVDVPGQDGWKHLLNQLATINALKQTGTYLQAEKKDLLETDSPLVASAIKLQKDIGREMKLVSTRTYIGFELKMVKLNLNF